jgi:hypothetical protein
MATSACCMRSKLLLWQVMWLLMTSKLIVDTLLSRRKMAIP